MAKQPFSDGAVSTGTPMRELEHLSCDPMAGD